MAERSRDRSSSNESQPKFPECSHFRRRNDNHRRCQQCRLNAGLPLCTQDSPCLVCQDWLPEAWTAHAKATAQRNRCKAAAAAKAARKETEMMDDSVELHAPRHAFPTKRPKSEESRVHRNPSPWLPASRRRNSPAPTGRATAGRGRLSANEDTANLRGISRHVVTATAVTRERESGTGQVPLVDLARADVPSPAVSQRRRTPVRRTLTLATARDDERAPTGRVGRFLSDGSSSYPLRSPRPMRNALSQWLPLQLDRFILNRPQQFQSRPR